ncbi:type II CRISPR-associated endonuclease Cas1 [Bacteroidetes/Chlorobi group bacterium ChocPot_Mid]|nr:MAG: type II CRISPR-associated endonuclease Cas1 [Bacteroidetes/Chlorobi group bacterium ChocPot_Mid]
MIKKIIYIGSPSYLSVKYEQLLIKNNDSGEVNSIPIEDMGYLELDSPQITITNICMQSLLAKNVALVSCNSSHIPEGIFLPLAGNSLQSKRMQAQVNCSLPTKKNLWKQLIQYKIKNQHKLLNRNGEHPETLKKMIDKVKSGDADNMEARASQYYWKNLFPIAKFKRSRFGDYPNNLLNYGYMVLRAITARAVVSSGLHPSVGLHHKNQYNPFCLADDVMEPFRPAVDQIVLKYYLNNPACETLTKKEKAIMLYIPHCDIETEKKTHPLMIAVQKMCSSIVDIFEDEKKELPYPELCLTE